jgi:protein-tyrosine-phosphatase
MGSETFDVAFVCTGNRYRSVIAEATFRAATEGLPVRIGSFGTLDVGPAPPLPDALLAARELGLDISSHLARCLVGADLRAASLVVGFELAHVAAAVVEARAAEERSFTLLELIELIDRVGVASDDDPFEQATQIVSRAHAARAASPTRPTGAEIHDPIGKRRSLQRAIARDVYVSANELATRLFGDRAQLGTKPPHIV